MKRFDLISIRNWLSDERAVVSETSATLSENLMALAQVIGMITMPLLPALLVAVSLLLELGNVAELTWEGVLGAGVVAWVVAFIAAVGLEALGITSSKTAMRMYRAWSENYATKREFIAVVITVGVYSALVSAVLIFGEHRFGGILYWLSFAAPLLSVSLYITIGFDSDLHYREEQRRRVTDHKRKINEELALAKLEDQKERMALKRDQDKQKFEMQQNLALEEERAKIDRKYRKLDDQKEKMSPTQRLEKAKQIYADNPFITGAELGRQLNVTERTGQNLLAQISTNGKHN